MLAQSKCLVPDVELLSSMFIIYELVFTSGVSFLNDLAVSDDYVFAGDSGVNQKAFIGEAGFDAGVSHLVRYDRRTGVLEVMDLQSQGIVFANGVEMSPKGNVVIIDYFTSLVAEFNMGGQKVRSTNLPVSFVLVFQH